MPIRWWIMMDYRKEYESGRGCNAVPFEVDNNKEYEPTAASSLIGITAPMAKPSTQPVTKRKHGPPSQRR